MNHAYRSEPYNPHVHWHIYPRYKTAHVINGTTFDDQLFGNFYDDTLQKFVSIETVREIANRLRRYLAS